MYVGGTKKNGVQKTRRRRSQETQIFRSHNVALWIFCDLSKLFVFSVVFLTFTFKFIAQFKLIIASFRKGNKWGAPTSRLVQPTHTHNHKPINCHLFTPDAHKFSSTWNIWCVCCVCWLKIDWKKKKTKQNETKSVSKEIIS